MGQTRRYADTLCKGNYDSPVLLSTTDPNKVTCKTCLKKMHGRPLPQPAPVVAIVPPAPKPIYIGPDYAAIRKRDWSAVHIAADNRRPFRFPPMSKADAERRDKGNWA